MLNSLLESLLIKRKIFTSYHHKCDQSYYDWISSNLSNKYNLFSDRALDEPVRSDDHEYVNRRIREEYIVGSSLTIVLCGAETYKRKYVDWEIHSTLHHKKGLLGIILPNCATQTIFSGNYIVPSRLYQNIQSGYAHWITWDHQQWLSNPEVFVGHIETALKKSESNFLIRNSDDKMQRNAA